jgi:Putative transposase
MALTASGQVRYTLKTPYRDGTTHIVTEPLDLMARLAALVPPPRMHLTRYHGVFAPHSRLRAAVTPAGRGSGRMPQTEEGGQACHPTACGPELGTTTEAGVRAVIAKILAHLERTAPYQCQSELPLKVAGATGAVQSALSSKVGGAVG